MADEKLSSLADIGPLQSGDLLYVVRAGVSYSCTIDEILGYIESNLNGLAASAFTLDSVPVVRQGDPFHC